MAAFDSDGDGDMGIEAPSASLLAIAWLHSAKNVRIVRRRSWSGEGEGEGEVRRLMLRRRRPGLRLCDHCCAMGWEDLADEREGRGLDVVEVEMDVEVEVDGLGGGDGSWSGWSCGGGPMANGWSGTKPAWPFASTAERRSFAALCSGLLF